MICLTLVIALALAGDLDAAAASVRGPSAVAAGFEGSLDGVVRCETDPDVVLEQAGRQQDDRSLDDEGMTGSPPAREPDDLLLRYLEGLLRASEEPHRRNLDGVVSRFNR